MLKNNIYVGDSKKYGKTLFANKDFSRGEFIFLIAGPIVTKGTIYTIPIANGLWIDPVDNHGKYLNHSCNPNAGIKQRTMVIAFKDVKKDEEITIDYAMIVRKYGDEMTSENIICRCGNENCRGKLGSWEELPEEIKKKYKGFVSDYLLE
ncbi:SET domain-containing protein-lysine N-methyltransferase [Candidatus Pacearchaeota archaeon]|nr:SET domain-containing protein-lysine N-methyltransferase [Candidatus Pacearchaeota archaeon]